ncbi:MAG: hypothetical protein LBS55_00825 [Prevotellaceae bacterium]|jgi:hypothetical protein|nr:hypothetical protein [Prevotellaceae bacterium]
MSLLYDLLDKVPENEPLRCTRMYDVPFLYQPIPPNLDMYPTVILSNETTAVIGINPKRGFILHSDGAKTELMDLQKLMLENLPFGVRRWAKEWVEKEYKKKYVNWIAMERERWKKEVEEWEKEVIKDIYKKYPHLKEQ